MSAEDTSSMLKRVKSWSLLAGAVLIGLSTTACAQLTPSALIPKLGSDTSQTDPQPDTSGVRLPASAGADNQGAVAPLGPNQAAVKLGSIEETFNSDRR